MEELTARAWEMPEDYMTGDGYDRYESFADRYRGDPTLRARIVAGDLSEALSELRITPLPETEMRIVANTGQVIHFVLPPDPNVDLTDETLESITGGATVSSAGTAATFGCLPSCVGSVSSAGSVGTAGRRGAGEAEIEPGANRGTRHHEPDRKGETR